MAFSEKEFAEALGVGAKVQAVADPADPQAATITDPTDSNPEAAGTETSVEGGQPTTAMQTEPTTGAVDDDQAGDNAEDGAEPMTTQQRRENAARRRQQEQRAAIDSAVNAARQQERERINAETKGFFERAQIKNSYTGQPITNMDEFMAWQDQHRKEQMEKDLKAGRLSGDALNEMISRHPVVQKAQALIEKSAADAAASAQAAMAEKVQEEIAEISKLDPSIKTVADLKNMPNFQQFYELVGKSYSFIDAYRLANFDRLTAQAAETGRQQAAVNARSKDHLQATGNARGAGAVSVPKDEMAIYRLLNPNATEAQIQAHYNKHKPK